MHEKNGGQWSQGWCGRTMGAPAPLAPPLGSRFHPGSFACMGILVMLVSDLYSAGSQRDRAKMHLIKLNLEYSCCKISHDFVLMSEYTCDQQKSSKIEQESWFV